MPKRAQMMKKANDEKENIPKLKESMSKRGHVEKNKCQKKTYAKKEHMSKRAHTKKSSFW